MYKTVGIGELIVAIIVLELLFTLIRRWLDRSTHERAFFKGYNRGMEDAGICIHDLHYWFNGRGNRVLNVTYLIGHYLKMYRRVDPARIREALDRMGDRKYVDIPQDELKSYL